MVYRAVNSNSRQVPYGAIVHESYIYIIVRYTMKQSWYFLIVVILVCQKCSSIPEDKNYWRNLGKIDIEEALSIKPNTGIAKNVILFIGDGMGPTMVTASRIYGKTEKGHLTFDKFPYVGALKTYSADKLVGDSSSAATAMFCGVKGNQQTAGVDANVPAGDCEASLKPDSQLESIVDWAQQAGKATGFVTTTRVTHATPAALYANSPQRDWECEAYIPIGASKCKDTARQLVEDSPGKNINVIMGGGRQCLVSNVKDTVDDPVETWPCYSRDGRNLIESWKTDKINRNLSYAVLENNEDLEYIDSNAQYVLGIFANSHLKFDHARNRGPKGMPSLTNMTEKAIEVLRKNSNGFFLMVEGGRIDNGNHVGQARKALSETVEFSNAVERAVEMTHDVRLETLIVVTSDHGHSIILTGYPDRTESVLDASPSTIPGGVPYTYLLYGTGGPNNFQFTCENNTAVRRNPQLEDTRSFEYYQQAAVLTSEVLHSGTDVLVYALGPMAHLFTSVHEQTYVAYVISYAAKIGPFKDSSSSIGPAQPLMIGCVMMIVIKFVY